MQKLAVFLLEQVELFSGFDRQRIDSLIDQSRGVTFEQHEAVIECGEEGRFLGVLLEGEAEVSVADDAGTRHRLTLLARGIFLERCRR